MLKYRMVINEQKSITIISLKPTQRAEITRFLSILEFGHYMNKLSKELVIGGEIPAIGQKSYAIAGINLPILQHNYHSRKHNLIYALT